MKLEQRYIRQTRVNIHEAITARSSLETTYWSRQRIMRFITINNRDRVKRTRRPC